MGKVINIVCSYSSIYGGNFIPSILYLSKKISSSKKSEVIFTFPLEAKERNWAKFIENQNFKVCFIDFKKAFLKNLRIINKKYKVTDIYSHFVSGFKIKMLYPFSKKIKLFIHVHSDFSAGKPESKFNQFKRFIEHRVLRKDANYIFVSKSMAQQYLENKNCTYLPNALAIDRTPCKKLDINLFKLKNNIKETDTLFLHFGWSPFVKGTDIVLKSFLKNINKGDECKLIIVYGKNDGYNQLLSFLSKENIFLGKNDSRLIFMPPTEDVFSLFEISDIFVSSSRSEGFSYSILESIYFNLRVFSSNIPAVQWACKYSNVHFYKNIDELDEIIRNSKNYKKKKIINKNAENDFSLEKWADILIEILGL